MKIRHLIQTIVMIALVVLCAGFGIYSFIRLNKVEHHQNFNLYSLVPQDAVAVIETDQMAALVDDINALACSKDGYFLYVSDLFVYLKNYLHTLVDDTPHGLSTQMNKMLFSFHEPDTPASQILYCRLGEGDYELVEGFIRKYASSNFPPKQFVYRGEVLNIYSLPDGRFLSTYFTSDFLVLSFQKKLIEKVIDAYRDKQSLLHQDAFQTMQVGKQQHLIATIYLRTKEVSMGKSLAADYSGLELGSWVEFDMKFDDTAIYCAGMTHEADTTQSFIATMQRQQAINGFPGRHLPLSTFFYSNYAITDCNTLFRYGSSQLELDTDTIYNALWGDFLAEYADGQATTCLFLPPDSMAETPCTVLRIPLKDTSRAVQRLGELPSPNRLFTRLSGLKQDEDKVSARIYRNALLLSPDDAMSAAYMQAIGEGRVLEDSPAYEESIVSLSSAYNFVMSVDVETMMQQPEEYASLVPNFFFRHAKFFRHFLLNMQLICTDEGVVYPNIVLLYKGI